MSGGLKRVKVIDLQADKRWALNGGPFGSKLSSKHYSENGVPVIRGKNLSGPTKFSFDEFVYVPDEKADELQANNAHPGDLVFTQRGTLGQVGLIPLDSPFKRFVISQSQMKLTVDEAKADPLYLYYYFTFEETVQDMHNMAFSSGVPHINLGLLREYEVSLPNLPTQRRIAGILSAYDDLIENNLRRIRILEEMAQSLYREWFVHFRIPSEVLKKAGLPPEITLVDSPLGPIPDGWEVKRMPEAVEVRPKIPVPKGDEIPFIPMGSLSEKSMLIGDVETRPKASGARFQNGDTVFARITPCLENGKTGFVQFLPDDETVCCGSTEFIVLRSKTVCPEYVYLMARSDPFRDNAIKSMSGATGRQRVRDECFEQFLLAQPPTGLLEGFSAITRPQFQLIHSLNRRNQTLRQTRDLLLPKLLSPTS